jgi:hypothetical protein
MYFIDISPEIITGTQEVDIEVLQCHEEVVEDRLSTFINYLKTLEGDFFIPSIIVCDKSNIIIDGHHRYHALMRYGVKKVPVTYIKYSSPEIKAYYDDRISKSEIIKVVNKGQLLSPKSSKHVIWDKSKKEYKPILLLASIWHINISTVNNNL